MPTVFHLGITRPWMAALIVLMAGGPAASTRAGLFEDPNLEKAVRQQVHDKRNSDKPLTAEDVRHVSTVQARSMNIRSLKGLEHCTQLASLDIAGNRIEDLGPLRGMNLLLYLDAADNRIGSLSPLKDLPQLQYLDVSGNRIESIDPIGEVETLNTLDLSDNKVGDLEPLKKLQRLWSLHLANNPLKSADPIGKLGWLSTLDLSGCGLKDLAFLAPLTSLRLLILEENRITDLQPLLRAAEKDAETDERFAPFLRLYLKGNPLSEEARSQQISALKQIGVTVES